MQNVIDFLRELKANNNREWFEQNKEKYKEVQTSFNHFVQELIDGISLFDPLIKGVEVKDSTFRIYRDVRFSHNKEPYKTYIGAHICYRGKKSGYAGYYFHLEPDNSFLFAGLHNPEPNVLRSAREEIADNGKQFVQAIQKAKGFHLDQSIKLQRAPKGFDENSEYIDYIKLKEFALIRPMEIDSDLLSRTLQQFKSCKEMNDLLNRAVKYAYEELK